MLTFHDGSVDYIEIRPDLASAKLPPRTVWVDILDGTEDEVAYVARATGLSIPTREEISEIESSSRLRTERGALYMTTPLVMRATTGAPETTSIGVLLTRDVLVTVRFAQLTAFSSFARDLTQEGEYHLSGPGAFIGLMDAIIDRAADVMEGVGGELDFLSQRVFRSENGDKRRKPARETADLREVLRRIGQSGDLASRIRDSLLGIGRIVSYVANVGSVWLPAELRPHLETQRHDVASLSDYDAHLNNKVQFLLDATMGLVNIEQNNIIKVLTVVSVVGVPPTLVASMYGMNFHNMPELSWTYGYPFGLLVIALSAIGPLLWFKLRGWL